MKESCKRLMAEWNRVIWGFVLMTTGWKMGIHSQSDQGFAGEKGGMRCICTGGRIPRELSTRMQTVLPGAAAASPSTQAHCGAGQLSIATQGCSRGSQDPHRWRHKHTGADGEKLQWKSPASTGPTLLRAAGHLQGSWRAQRPYSSPHFSPILFICAY